MPKRQKKRTQKPQDAKTGVTDEEVTEKQAPKSMIFRRGKVGHSIIQLIHDMRKVMAPYTAENLKESKKNSLKDFLSVAPQLGVTHFMCFNQNERGATLRVMRTPQGPTMTFRLQEYSLMKDVVASQRKPHSPGNEFNHPPLLVLNNFSGHEEHKQLMTAMFQHMYPPIDVKNIKLSHCRRVVLFNLDPATNLVEFRQFVVNASPVGLTKSIKRIIKGKMPDLSGRQDISDYVFDPGAMSDSEIEDGPENKVILSQAMPGRGNRTAQKSAIRLKEVGPRMTLELLKIEQEICGGQVLYHALKTKSKEEVAALLKQKEEKKRIKMKRKREQEANVARKKNKKKGRNPNDSDSEAEALTTTIDDAAIDDDDRAWFKSEVGANPESGLFAERSKFANNKGGPSPHYKKGK